MASSEDFQTCLVIVLTLRRLNSAGDAAAPATNCATEPGPRLVFTVLGYVGRL